MQRVDIDVVRGVIYELPDHFGFGFLHGIRSLLRNGQGYDQAMSSPYQPGDDMRREDWHLTERFGEVHIKRYDDEAQALFWLVVDVDYRQMHQVGVGQRKSDFMLELASYLALIAAGNDDRVGLVLSGLGRPVVIPPCNRHDIDEVIDALEGCEADECDTSLADLLREVPEPYGNDAVVVISDLLENGWSEALLDVFGESRHVEVFRSLDPVDEEVDAELASHPNLNGTIRDRDENGRVVRLNLRKEAHRNRYNLRVTEDEANIQQLLGGIPTQAFDTSVSVVDQLLDLLDESS